MELMADIANPAFPDSWFAGCMGGSPGEAYAICYENPLVNEINYNSNPALMPAIGLKSIIMRQLILISVAGKFRI